MKEQTLIQKYRAIQKIGSEVNIPWQVNHILGCDHQKIEIFADQVSIGSDSCSLDEAREAVAWYVKQLGGKVEWDNETATK
jgi:hypothetical protein